MSRGFTSITKSSAAGRVATQNEVDAHITDRRRQCGQSLLAEFDGPLVQAGRERQLATTISQPSVLRESLPARLERNAARRSAKKRDAGREARLEELESSRPGVRRRIVVMARRQAACPAIRHLRPA